MHGDDTGHIPWLRQTQRLEVLYLQKNETYTVLGVNNVAWYISM